MQGAQLNTVVFKKTRVSTANRETAKKGAELASKLTRSNERYASQDLLRSSYDQ